VTRRPPPSAVGCAALAASVLALAGCRPATPARDGAEGAATPVVITFGTVPAGTTPPPGRGAVLGYVVDSAADVPVAAVRVRLVRAGTNTVVAEAMSGIDGSYVLGLPPAAELPDGEEVTLEALLPPDHVFAAGYATPTPFAARKGLVLRHDVLLVGP
jgi:hypothetical protein